MHPQNSGSNWNPFLQLLSHYVCNDLDDSVAISTYLQIIHDVIQSTECADHRACNGQFLAIVAQIERLFFFHAAQILYLAHPQHHASTISSVWYGIQWSYNGLDRMQNIARTLPFTSIQMWHGHHYHNIVSPLLPFIIIQHFLWEPSYKLSNNINVW